MTNLLAMSKIAKRFGQTVALADVSLEVAPGEVHALVGENGAGKSTLIKILAGAERADAGTILFRGQSFSPRKPLDAIRAGIAVVYQEFNLAPHLSVLANLLLGRERSVCGFLAGQTSRGGDRRRCAQTLQRLGIELPLDRRVGALGVADQQMVEIARALLGGARLVVMDEPTSALASHESERLFSIIEELRRQGIGVIYISHFLEEVQRLADRVTVLRDGRSVGSGPIAEFPRKRMIEAMVGRDVEEMDPRGAHEAGAPVLELEHLEGARRPRDASLVLRRGQILGIAGLVGAGRTEMLRTLFGLDPRTGGEVIHQGVRVATLDPAIWVRRGVSLLSEDRKSEGLAQSLSCVSNVTLPAMTRASRFGFLAPLGALQSCGELARRLKIRWSSPRQKVGQLSGGNQQKVAFARLLYCDANVLLLDEPTRGIDVASKVDLYRVIRDLAGAGKAVVIVSSYLPELLGVCDEVAVMVRGRLTATTPTQDLTPEHVMGLAVGEHD